MKCLDDCHTYEVDNSHLLMHFYEKTKDGTEIEGVTNEEVLKVLIHRITYLNEKCKMESLDVERTL